MSQKTPAAAGFIVPGSLKVNFVRAVHRPKAIGHDPDENTANSRALHGVDHMVYAGIENTNRIHVVADAGNNRKQGFVLGPRVSTAISTLGLIAVFCGHSEASVSIAHRTLA